MPAMQHQVPLPQGEAQSLSEAHMAWHVGGPEPELSPLLGGGVLLDPELGPVALAPVSAVASGVLLLPAGFPKLLPVLAAEEHAAIKPRAPKVTAVFRNETRFMGAFLRTPF